MIKVHINRRLAGELFQSGIPDGRSVYAGAEGSHRSLESTQALSHSSGHQSECMLLKRHRVLVLNG